MKKLTTLFIILFYTFSYGQVDYNTQIQPIFDANCTSCHWVTGGYTESGLDLQSYNLLMEGGESGDVIENGLLEDYIISGYMPAYGATNFPTSEEIDLIIQWISEGANPSGGEDCPCINPDWINPNAVCSSDWSPVTGCDGVTYSNSCVAEANGVTSYEDSDGIETILVWDCETEGEGCYNTDGDYYNIGSEWFFSDCYYSECLGGGVWSDILELENCGGCTLSDGSSVPNGWYGNGVSTNWCNTCECENDILSCTEMWCEDEGCWEDNEFYCIGCVLFLNECDYIECEGPQNWSSTITIDDCGDEGCWEENEWYCIGCEYIIDECTYVECLDNNQWSNWIEIENCEDCIIDVDEDGICEDDCEVMQYMVVDCECSFFDPNTYTVFFTTVDEENCLIIEDCGCECINDVNQNGICDEEEEFEGCTDTEACNYMPSATINNNSCFYDGDPECEDCGTVLNYNNYGDNEYFSNTYYAPPGVIITINFSGSTESCCDHVYVNGVEYDGILDGIVIGDEVLDIEWTTDSSVNSASGYGWSAELICEEAIEGCTQLYADNYNPNANTDDGSCILDCEYFLSYDSYLNDYETSSYYCGLYVSQGTYTIEQAISYGYNCDCVILGCMDETAINYSENATIEANCSCEYEEVCTIVSVTGGSYPTEVSWEIEDENGNIVLNGGAPYCENFCFEDGCYTIHMNDSFGDGWNNAVLNIEEYDYTFTTGSSAIAPFGYNNDNCIIEGCTNSLADNYNEEANYDDGSCEYGCEYLLSYESYEDLSFDNSVSNYYCGYYLELGYYSIEEMENMGYNCDCVIVGCTDEEATNYDEEAFVDDCSCVYENDCPAISFNTTDSSLGWRIDNMDGETILEYNTSGTEIGNYCGNYCFEDGCYIITMTSMWGGGWYQTSLDIGDDSFTLPTGYEGIAAFAYNTDMNCEIGCTDPEASNYNPDAILDDGSCVVFGCTITVACNYNPDATAFDGSCYYCYMDDCNTYPSDFYNCDGNCFDFDEDGVCDWDEIIGCTDETACNYNTNATEEGSCEYPEMYYDCNGVCINDNDADEICNEIDNCPLIYNPDQTDLNNDGIGDDCDGISLKENGDFEWNIYPNPFRNYTTINFKNTNNNMSIKITNLSGKIIYNVNHIESGHKINNIFSPGYYIIQLESNKTIVRETLIIQ